MEHPPPTWLVDLDTGRSMSAPYESDITGSVGSKVFLLRRSDGWAAVADLATGQLPVRTAPYAYRGAAGRWGFAHLEDGGNVVVDVAAARVAGFVAGPEALGLSDDGLLLTSAPPSGDVVVSGGLPSGPLRWFTQGGIERP